jgi:hypothetical protein
MDKPQLKVIEGGKVEAVEIPERHEFACYKCGGSCVMFPRSKPIAVQHSLPTCKAWQRVEKKLDHVEGFLTKSGADLLIPKSDG